VLESRDELEEADEPQEVPTGDLTVAFDDVHFSYRDRETGERFEAVRGIGFELGPSDRVVILGPSGSGKSTTGKLIPRLFDPDRGEVTANGVSLKRLDLEAWRGRVGYIGQEVSLFHGTIRDNIVFGVDEPNEAELERAVRVAAVDEIAEEKADGLDALVGEKGGKLSGGQRKRVAMARALLRDPDILVVDQFAADIEQRLCRRVFEAIADEYDVSLLYVGHRVPAGLGCDRVYWMEHGGLQERTEDFAAEAQRRGGEKPREGKTKAKNG
jgi:ABC-type multidrug transport system fused ATPase/permease subunit